jgi:nucleoside-diphosphate-sugar epimerase
MSETILINGNLGYIGPIVARHLRTIHPDSRLHGFDSGFFAGCLVDPRIFPEAVLDAQFFGDVRRPPRDLFRGTTGVVQLAAISNDPMGDAFAKVTGEINADAAVTAARLARDAGARGFVFVSSCSVYGAAGDEAKTETSALNPLTAYARSKIAAEEALRPLATADFAITCLRFATACGFSPRIRLDLVLNDFVASAIVTNRISILSDGTPWRPLIHVKDMARAIEWALMRRPDEGGSFLVINVGTNTWNYRVRELAEAVKREFDKVDVTMNPNAPPDLRSYRVNFAQYAALAPAHQPQETLPSAIQDISAGLRAAGFADAHFRSSNFIRLPVLSHLRNSGLVDADLYWNDSR